MVTVYTRAIMSASVWGTAAWHAATIPANGNGPQPLPSGRTDLGCTMVADGHFEGLAEGSERTKSLQIHGGPQGSRTPDLRRAKAALSQLS